MRQREAEAETRGCSATATEDIKPETPPDSEASANDFALLNKAYENREDLLTLLKVDPRFDSLHDDPRFRDLARRFKIAP